MQLRYSIKKEWSQFTRTFRLGGILAAALAVVLLNPLLFKFTGAVLQEMSSSGFTAVASVSISGDLGMDFEDMAEMYSDSGLMFAATMSSMASVLTLVMMLVLGSAAGGEQKKRAMIIPTCSGLNSKNYVLSKFIVYPPVCFAVTFAATVLCGVLCNALFPYNKISIALLFLGAVMAGIYVMFIVSVFLSLGICTSKPGVMAAVVFIGTAILDTVIRQLGIIDFNPFTLLSLVAGEMFINPDFALSDYAASIAVGAGISLLVCVLMCLLAVAVLNAKKINNREEKKPEF